MRFMDILQMAKNAKAASVKLLSSKAKDRNGAILAIAQNLLDKKAEILAANAKDIDLAKQQKTSAALIDRLLLDEKRLLALIESVKSIAAQDEVVFQTLSETKRKDGLIIQKQSIPLGVIGMIFESRPNVIIDAATLAIKSANAVLLKGGKEAQHSNQILSDIVREAITLFIPRDTVQLITSKEQIADMLELRDYIDLVIPRGGEGLIDYVYKNSKIPVIAHFKGLCHIYIDESANLTQAIEICLNAKVQRPGVCNAMETLLLHEKLPTSFYQKLFQVLNDNHVEIRADEITHKILPETKLASPADWDTEYLDKILSVKTVRNIDEAISHIQKHGTHHTEAILSTTTSNIEKFLNSIDASCITVNASTRFNDGGELGLGAEIGISTSKIHAYGPMGAKELCTARFVIVGEGHIRK
jgi:glutamate-5-semialdehyde dehydrogenase